MQDLLLVRSFFFLVGAGALALAASPPDPPLDDPWYADQVCEIQLDRSLEMNNPAEGPGIATSWVSSDGERLFLIDVDRQTEFQVFDATSGDFIRSVGREGQGPGEYLNLRAVQAWGDSLLLFDASNARMSLLDQDLNHVRSWRAMVAPVDFQPFTDVEGLGLVVNGWSGTQRAAGYPLHLIAPDGSIVRSFGDDPDHPYRSPTSLDGFRIGPSESGPEMWTVRVNQYLLELWDVRSGDLVRSIAVDQAWPADGYANGERVYDVAPMIFDLQMDDRGLLWIVGRETIDQAPPSDQENFNPPDLAQRVDLRLDVVDPEHGQVIATRGLSDYYGGFLETGQMFSFRSMEQPGQMTVWDPRLSCTPPNHSTQE